MFSPDGTLISASAAPHCGERKEGKCGEGRGERTEGTWREEGKWGGEKSGDGERREMVRRKKGSGEEKEQKWGEGKGKWRGEGKEVGSGRSGEGKEGKWGEKRR